MDRHPAMVEREGWRGRQFVRGQHRPLAHHHDEPGDQAVIPRHFEFDEFSETPYPGGVLTDSLIKAWNAGNQQLDSNPGVRLVDEDQDQSLYREATKRRGENMNVYTAALKTDFRDDRA